jgi:hypothetical protein
MSDTAKRLADKDDGKVAKLRAAGDKRREAELKGRNIAKRNEAFSQAAADRNKIKYQQSGRIGHGLGWKDYVENPKEIVDGIVDHFDNITRIVQYDMASDRVKQSIIERFFKKYGYPFELMNDVIIQIERKIDLSYKAARAGKKESFNLKNSLQELSNDMLGKYKKAASADASRADKEGNVKRGDKRFSGIVKATNKQFANDAKKTK